MWHVNVPTSVPSGKILRWYNRFSRAGPPTRRSFSIIAAYVLGALLVGCGRMVSVDYEPTNPLKGQGTVIVTPFRYEAVEDHRVRPRQVETNPAAKTELYLTQEISSFFTDALQMELARSGYSIEKSGPLTLSGAIRRFYVDWRNGVERFFELHATYTVQSPDHALYSWECTSVQHGSNTLAQDSTLIRKGTADCMKRFIQAAQEAKAL
jgi:hypothetical protein